MGFVLPPSVAQTAPICCNAKGLHSWVTLCWILWVSSCHLLWHRLLLFAAMQRGFIVGYLCWILWISSCHLLWHWLLLSAAMQKGFIVGYPLLNAMNFILLSAAVVLWCQNHSSSNKANPNRCFKFISTVFQIPIFFSVQKHFAPAQMFLNEQGKILQKHSIFTNWLAESALHSDLKHQLGNFQQPYAETSS